MIKRQDQSDFVNNFEILKRGTIKIASSMLPGTKDASTHNEVKKMFKTFEKSPDVSKETLELYKQKAQFSDKPNEVAKDFLNDFSKARQQKKKMSLITAKTLRQNGIFKISGRDVYEDLDTGDFWKITSDKKNIIRMFKEDENGCSDKNK
jgi:hypothetical protein